MIFDNQSIQHTIQNRNSCRSFTKTRLDANTIHDIEAFLSANHQAPFGTAAHFHLAAAGQDDAHELRGLGTYGVIRNPAAFIIGAVGSSAKNLEDFGYLMEKNILYLSGLGLGSCWLGGSFQKSGFEKKMNIAENEMIPAVAALGWNARKKTMVDRVIHAKAASKTRKEWGELFFQNDFSLPLVLDNSDHYKGVLDMVRLAPSAANLQPWRLVKETEHPVFHFFAQKSKGYQRTLKFRGKPDLQRIDMGIAMCHFELAAGELNLPGRWEIDDPKIALPNDFCSYVVSWIG